MLPAANEARKPSQNRTPAASHPASGASRPASGNASKPASGARRPGGVYKPQANQSKPGASKPGAQGPAAARPNPQGNHPAAQGKPAAGKPQHNNQAQGHHGPHAYKPNTGNHGPHGQAYHQRNPRSPHYRPGHAYWPGYSYRPASYVPYRHSRYWYWGEPYHVVVRPFYRYYVPVYAPFVFWMGFPLVVYEDVVYVSGPQTVVVTETYYEDSSASDDGWYEESENVESDWSSNQTYTVWEDETEETYPWEDTQIRAQESYDRLEEEAGTVTLEEATDSVGNEGTIEPEYAEEQTASPDLYQAEVERQVLDLINQKRTEAGLPLLRETEKLKAAASGHSEEMFRLNYFDHESPVEANRTLPQRLVNAGLQKYGWAGENIAMVAQPAAQALVDMWMKSQGHRENLLRADFKFTGLAIYGEGDKFYATQVFSSNQ